MNKIKVLFLAANPLDTTHLRLDEEIRLITTKLRASDYRDSIELISAWAVRADDLLQLLNEHKPHIVHFSGHGNTAGEIALLDNNGFVKPVNAAALASLFKTLKDNIRMVVLNACYSQPIAKAITQSIDCAVGMVLPIGDPAAIIFAASFYRAVGFGRSVFEAFQQAKTALMLEGIPEENTPKLLMRRGLDPLNLILIDAAMSFKETQLHSHAQSVRDSYLLRNLQELIDSNADKASIQDFIKSNPDILRRWWKIGSDRVLADVKFGDNLVDFAIGVFHGTLGVWEWTLVDLESPSQDLFTETGDKTTALNKALQKATEWRAWIQSHLQDARSTLPDISPMSSIAIMMGRRRSVRGQDKERLVMLKISMPGIVINTYDSLIESVQKV